MWWCAARGSMSLECAGAMHRHCDLVRAEHPKGPEHSGKPQPEKGRSREVAQRSVRRHITAANLKAGTYRSAAAYLGICKQMHTKAGHPWTADLVETRIECGRSLGRGVGPAKRAAVVALPDRWEQADTADGARIDVAVVRGHVVATRSRGCTG